MGNGYRPTPEIRRVAVRLALMSGGARREIAEDLGIGLGSKQTCGDATALARCFVAPGS